MHMNPSLSVVSWQPRKPGSLPTPGAATNTLVQAGHVTPQNLGCF